MPDRRSGGERVTEVRRAVSVFDPPRVRFDERAELGRGGMGRVVEAIDLALDRPVAIKHLLASGLEDHARFEREVRITARLQHPSIVPILDAGRDAEGQPFYIMRKIDGEPLSARVTAATTARDRIALVPAMLGAVDAAAYAHAQGVIHRDIKPWNILLGPFGETLLIDWGIARDLAAVEAMASSTDPSQRDSGLTRVGHAVGTPGFMAPEQARGEPVDRRADVYSLGATLYFVLTGALPFAGSDATVAISTVAAGGGPDLTKIPPEVPAELGAIVVKALAADRAERYADASELAADVRRFLAGQLVAAHHYTAGERFVRWIRRHRIAAAVTIVAVIAIAVTAIVAFRSVVVQRDQAQIARDEAQSARALAEARAEELLVDRARSLASTDPTSAVALLRSLPAGSKLWPVAREIVRASVPGGVERRLVGDQTYIYALAISSDGRLAVAGRTTIELHDIERGTRRVLAKHTASRIAWRDAKTLLFSDYADGGRSQLGLIDAETGAERLLQPRDLRGLAALDGSILAHNQDGSLDLYDAALHRTQLATTGVAATDVRGSRAVILGLDALIVLEPGLVRRRRSIALSRFPLSVRISPDGERVAALFADEILEWQMTGEAPPRRWPRSGKESQGVAYIGELLYAWDDSGGGLVSLEGDLAITRWAYRGTLMQPAAFDHGAVLATEEGRLAIVDRLGVVELPHRRISLKEIATSPDGRHLVIAATDGELTTIDLLPVRPLLVPATESTSIYGASHDKLLIGEAVVDALGSTGPTRLAILDLTSGKRIDLGDVGFAPYVIMLDAMIVVGSGIKRGQEPNVHTLTLLDLDGREKLSVPYSKHIQVTEGLHAKTSALYGAPNGDVVELPLDPLGPPRTLRVADGKFVARIMASPQGIALTVLDAKSTPMKSTLEWIELGSRKAPALEIDNTVFSPGFGPDGSWWLVENMERVVRIAPDGSRHVVTLPQPIRLLTIRGDRIVASSAMALYYLAPDGTLLRTVSVPNTAKRGYLRDGLVSVSDDGLWITMPGENVSRLLPVPGGADQQAATPDGRFIAALSRTTPRYVALWRDPVPREPSAVSAYLEQLTNAQLDLASSTVTWDRPRP